MSLFEIIILAIALAMDCLTVSIVSGVILRERSWKVIIRMSFLFGFFQAMMPCLGWLGTSFFAEAIEAYDHWIAFTLLSFLGVNMIREAFKPEEEHHFNPTRLTTQITMAIATSIDALAVGISFACMGYREMSTLSLPLWIIGIASFLFSIIGQLLGIRFGRAISNRLKPELLGGAILIAIGCKILYEHLTDNGAIACLVSFCLPLS